MGSSRFVELSRRLDPPLWLVTASDGESTGGLVATFVTPASIVPSAPRVLLGVARHHRTWELIEASGSFALHLVEHRHGGLAARFSLDSSRHVDKLTGLAYRTGETGSPILEGFACWLECRVESRMETGDRTVYLGEVVDEFVGQEFEPLRAGEWFRGLSEVERSRLAEQLASDVLLDEEEVNAWRRARGGLIERSEGGHG
jgi:flavin reductase (DIM6/NTAB) family NADH-FMN oxidoreductase RutF